MIILDVFTARACFNFWSKIWLCHIQTPWHQSGIQTIKIHRRIQRRRSRQTRLPSDSQPVYFS